MRSIAGTWAQRLNETAAGGLTARLAERIRPLMRGGGVAGRMAVSTYAIRVAGAAFAYLSQIVLARLMGAHDYGIFSVSWTLVVVLGAMACCGFSSSANRFIPQYSEAGDDERLRGFMRAGRLIAFATGALLCAAGMGAVHLLEPVIDPAYTLPVTVVLLAMPFFAFGMVQDGIARSYDWPAIAMLPTYIWRPMAILAILFIIVASGSPAAAITAAAAAVAATAAVALYQYIKLAGRIAEKIPRGPHTLELNTWIAVSFPMLMVDGFLQLITSADVIMVSFFEDPKEVAVYFAASKTLALVHFVYFAVRAASAHRFSRYIHTDDQDGLNAYMRQATLWTFWPSLVAGLGLLVAAPVLLLLFGEDFTAGYPIVAILLIGVLARASIGPADALLTMTGHQRTCAMIYATTFAVNVVLNLYFIPQYGIVGAAIATSLAIIFEACVLTIAARRKLNVTTFVLPLLFARKGAPE